MLPIAPAIIFSRSSSRKSRNGGPALLVIRMSGSGQTANSLAWPSAVPTSATTALTLALVALRMSSAVFSRRLGSSPLTVTSQPASASRMAQARPSPRLEAQTMALRPAIPRSMKSSLLVGDLIAASYAGVIPRFRGTTAPSLHIPPAIRRRIDVAERFRRSLDQLRSASHARASVNWQRRCWEHTLRNENDFSHHVGYIHFNPVKHGHVKRVKHWPHSSFHWMVRRGFYADDWASDVGAERVEFGEG